MAGFRATVPFLLGTLAGLGAALLLFVTHLLEPNRPVLYLSSTNAFLVGIWLITGGVLGGVAVARWGIGTWDKYTAGLPTSLGSLFRPWRRADASRVPPPQMHKFIISRFMFLAEDPSSRNGDSSLARTVGRGTMQDVESWPCRRACPPGHPARFP